MDGRRYIIGILVAFVCALSSCVKEEAATTPEWDAFDFVASETRKTGTNEFGVDVTLVKGGRDAWYSLTMNVDGEYRKDLSREGRIFTDSEKLSVECGSFRNGRHVFELSMRDKLDSLVTHRVSFNCIGDGEGEEGQAPQLSFGTGTRSVFIGEETVVTVKVFPAHYRDSIRWSVEGEAVSLLSRNGDSAVVTGVGTGEAVLKAEIVSSKGNASDRCVLTSEWKEGAPLFRVDGKNVSCIEGGTFSVKLVKPENREWDNFFLRVKAMQEDVAFPLFEDIVYPLPHGDGSASQDGDGRIFLYEAGKDSGTLTFCNVPLDMKKVDLVFYYGTDPTEQEETVTVAVSPFPEQAFRLYGDPELTKLLGVKKDMLPVCLQDGVCYLETDGSVPDFPASIGLLAAERVSDRVWKLIPADRGTGTFTVSLFGDGRVAGRKVFSYMVYEKAGFFVDFAYERKISVEQTMKTFKAGFRMEKGREGLIADVDMTLKLSAYVDESPLCSVTGDTRAFRKERLDGELPHLVDVHADMELLQSAVEAKGYRLSDLRRVWVEAFFSFFTNDNLMMMEPLGAIPIEDLNVIVVPEAETVSMIMPVR